MNKFRLLFCMNLRRNSDYFLTWCYLTAFYNRVVCLLRGTNWFFKCHSEYSFLKVAMPWRGRLVAGLSPWRPGFDPWSVHVVLVVKKIGTGTGQYIPPMFRTLIHPRVALTRRQTDEVWEPSKKKCSFRNGGALDIKVLLLFSSLKA
jgi:hypothetical protein